MLRSRESQVVRIFGLLDGVLAWLRSPFSVGTLADVTQGMAVETEDEQSRDDLTPSVDLLEIAGRSQRSGG